MTKKIIGRGHELEGLYIFYHQIPTVVACSGVTSSFEVYCRLGYPSLFVLKKSCPEFRFLSSLNCDSCLFAKFHCLSFRLKVHKEGSAPFQLVLFQYLGFLISFVLIFGVLVQFCLPQVFIILLLLLTITLV